MEQTLTRDECDPSYTAVRQWDSREGCEVRHILERIADKWSLLAIAILDSGPRRFNELRREIDGVSQRMLTVTLRHLERDGLVSRTVFPTVPPQVEYALTEMGRSLHETVGGLVSWTVKHQDAITEARDTFDAQGI
jgi:DNA-binding HxlR family transcriptional regulator